MAYAINTEVGVEKSEAEIKTMLKRAGAVDFATREGKDLAVVMFQINATVFKITLCLPSITNDEITLAGTRYAREPSAIKNAYNQAHRSYWRSLALAIKAKLEAIDRGISTLEREFFADIVLPSGVTMAEYIQPQLERMGPGRMPTLNLLEPGK